MKILVFAGTSEARSFCHKACGLGFDVTASVATEYGKELIAEDFSFRAGSSLSVGGALSVIQGRLDAHSMKNLVCGFDAVVDATHPYAVEVTKNIKIACDAAGKLCFRLLRNISDFPLSSDFNSCFNDLDFRIEKFDSIEKIADFIRAEDEKLFRADKSLPSVFLSTGSKELLPFTRLKDYKRRVFVRVLPIVESIKKCEECGFLKKNIIAMQGPFSAALNEAMFRECKAEILVTKISGKNGGFYEKITAARKCGMRVLAVTSPHECGEGVFKSEDEILSVLAENIRAVS